MTVFISSLELFINLSKVIGLINFCITFDKGLLNRDTYSTYNVFLELIRTFVFVVSSWHIFFSLNTFYSLHYVVVKYWSLIITARMLENRIIKYECLHYLFSILSYNFRNGLKENFSSYIGSYYMYNTVRVSGVVLF